MAQGHLARSDDEYPTLFVTPSGHAVLRGETAPAPLTTAASRVAAPVAEAGAPSETQQRQRVRQDAPGPDTSGVADTAVFEALRALRRKIAEERGVPPYLIFSDASLRDMARVRPMTLAEFRDVKGVGDWKLETFGDRFVAAVRGVRL